MITAIKLLISSTRTQIHWECKILLTKLLRKLLDKVLQPPLHASGARLCGPPITWCQLVVQWSSCNFVFPPMLPGGFETSFAVSVTPGGKLTLKQHRMKCWHSCRGYQCLFLQIHAWRTEHFKWAVCCRHGKLLIQSKEMQAHDSLPAAIHAETAGCNSVFSNCTCLHHCGALYPDRLFSDFQFRHPAKASHQWYIQQCVFCAVRVRLPNGSD